MGYVFNKGTIFETVVTKAVKTSYYIEDRYTSFDSHYLLEFPVPTNVAPIVAAMESNTDYVLFKLDSTTSVVLRVQWFQANTVKSAQIGFMQGGIFVAYGQPTLYPVDHMPTVRNYYFLYAVAGSGSNIIQFCIIDRERHPVAISVKQIAPEQYPAGYLCGEINTNTYDLQSFNRYNVIPSVSKNPQGLYRDPDYIPVAPTQNIQILNDSTWVDRYLTLDPSITSITQLKDRDNNSAEEYVGPTPEPDPEEPFVPSTPDPYDPYPEDSSDEIPVPNSPVIGITTAGFINVYNPGMNALQGLGDILFPNVASATDTIDAILKICQALQNQNLINYIIDCHVIPTPPSVGTNQNIKVGFRDTGISVPVVTNDYIDATCGTLSIREFFSGFQDYACTLSKLYLPFIGFVDTKPEYWQSGTIGVDYKFNIIDGSFMCYVKATSSKSALANTVIAQYAGNACMHFPITGANYSSMVSGIVGAGVALATAGTGAAALGAMASAANSVRLGPEVQQSNGYNSTAALMGVRTPYLLIERPVAAYPSGYGHDKGFPANITTQLSNVVGYTEIEDIDLSGIPLTQAELEELRGLLKEGVYF